LSRQLFTTHSNASQHPAKGGGSADNHSQH
jgi:hypothetical protein